MGDVSRVVRGVTAGADERLGGEQRHLSVVGDEHRLPRFGFGNAVMSALQPDLLNAVELDEAAEGVTECTTEQ